MNKTLIIYYEYTGDNTDRLAGRKSLDEIERVLGYFPGDFRRKLRSSDKSASVELKKESSSNYIIVEVSSCLTEPEFDNDLASVLKEHLLSTKQVVNEEEYIALLNIELKKHPEYVDGMVVIGVIKGNSGAELSGWQCEGPGLTAWISSHIEAIVNENYQLIATKRTK